jgi:pimeloyl-ACP methyl ester carboxylesterase
MTVNQYEECPMSHPIDAPEIVNNLFFPQRATARDHSDKAIKDGFVKVEEDIRLGYRFYIKHSTAPVLLFFHGNGEIAPDYDSFASYYHEVGLSLLVVDYRGYGWSDGKPLPSKMLPDAQTVLDGMNDILKEAGLVPERPIFVMGRSLGSAPAIYLALKNPDALKGLIIESGYADAPSLFRRLGIPIPDNLPDEESLPIGNGEKIKRVSLPLLVIHGELDMLIPAEQGKALYEASPVQDKQLLIIKGAGHNNVSFVQMERYFTAIKNFVEKHQA